MKNNGIYLEFTAWIIDKIFTNIFLPEIIHEIDCDSSCHFSDFYSL